ncbi:peptidoglycan DD-metalloendopeptidase family protein [Reichenbachiella sp.]|uniref:peptidoglycan DD-metalloendopeptidase family protein n=1 Tax=Reichenbachiella sp. TaxID=2184521 RepID=UPI003296EBC8
MTYSSFHLFRIILFALLLGLSCCNQDEGPSIVLIGDPPITAVHNRPYTYEIKAEADADNNGLSIQTIQIPNWLSLDADSNTLSGTAGWSNLDRTFSVELQATQGDKTLNISYTLIVALGEIICDSPFGNPSESEYALPYNIGESYRMWQSYCHPQWSHKNWFSYDFDMPMGTEILASRTGTVIFERDEFEDGTNVSGNENFIFIQHIDGTVVHYVHLMKDGSLVSVGQKVEQGELIGLSGNSGGSAGPHLHTSQFIGRSNFDRQYSIPMNYKNAAGELNANNGLVIEVYYEALPYEN